MDNLSKDQISNEMAQAIDQMKEALLYIRIHESQPDILGKVHDMLASVEEKLRTVRGALKTD